jgi:hypothetical protein
MENEMDEMIKLQEEKIKQAKQVSQDCNDPKHKKLIK